MAVRSIYDIINPDSSDILEGGGYGGSERFFPGNIAALRPTGRQGLGSLFAGQAQAGELDDENLMDAALRMKMSSGLMNIGETVPNDDDELIIKYFKLIGDPTE